MAQSYTWWSKFSCDDVKKESSFGFFPGGRNPTSRHSIQTLNPGGLMQEEYTAVAQLFAILHFYFVLGFATMWLTLPLTLGG